MKKLAPTRKKGRVLKGIFILLIPLVCTLTELLLFQKKSVQRTSDSFQNLNLSIQTPDPIVEIQKPTTETQETVGFPVRLTISTIKINAKIQAVGLAPDGTMDIPKLVDDAAWYMLGPKPGEEGSAVIAGHINWLYGAAGVFEHLHTLKPGDVITTEDDRGVRTSFVVHTSRLYNEAEDTTDIFRSNDGLSHLNLITCAGVWNKVSKTYSKRLVVFADKVEKQ